MNMDATSTRSDNDFESTVMNIDEPEEVPRKNTVVSFKILPTNPRIDMWK